MSTGKILGTLMRWNPDTRCFDYLAEEWHNYGAENQYWRGDKTFQTIPGTDIQFSATDKILGRATAGAGAGEEIACTAAGRALLDDASAADQRTTLGLGTMATVNDAPSDSKQYARKDAAWVEVTGGSGDSGDGDWTLIEDKYLSSGSAASFNFTSIAGTYKHLKLVMSVQAGDGSRPFKISFNGDTGNNYVGTSAWLGSSSGSTNQVSAGGPFSLWSIGAKEAATMCSGEVIICNYASTMAQKSYHGQGLQPYDIGASMYVYFFGGMWLSTAAINQITLTPSGGDLIQYSRCTLYGIS